MNIIKNVATIAASTAILLSTSLPSFADDGGVREHYLQNVPAQQERCIEDGGRWTSGGCRDGDTATNSSDDGGNLLGWLIATVVVAGVCFANDCLE